MADEKHCTHKGERVYWAVTAAKGCIVGSCLSPTAGYEDLQAAYGDFEQEMSNHAPDYYPETVTTDGWEATRRAWETLFPGITWILCFLHEVIKVRDWCRSKPDLRTCLTDKLWHKYLSKINYIVFSKALEYFLNVLNQLLPTLVSHKFNPFIFHKPP